MAKFKIYLHEAQLKPQQLNNDTYNVEAKKEGHNKIKATRKALELEKAALERELAIEQLKELKRRKVADVMDICSKIAKFIAIVGAIVYFVYSGVNGSDVVVKIASLFV